MKELNLENYDLSDKAITLLKDTKREEALNDKEEVEKVFRELGIPIFEKVIDFQVRFGGISYRIGESFRDGFKMRIISLDYKKNYTINYEPRDVIKNKRVLDTRYYYECMEYDYAGDWGPHIDQDGKIFGFAMGCLYPMAETIEEYLEDEAIKHDLLKKSWINQQIPEERGQAIIENKNMKRIENKHFSYSYFNWWKNDEETIFIRIETDEQTLGGYLTKYTEIYCSNQDLLDSLYENEILELQEKGLSDKEIATKLKLREAFVTRILDKKFSIEIKYINTKRDWIRAGKFMENKAFKILKRVAVPYLIVVSPLYIFSLKGVMLYAIVILYIIAFGRLCFVPVISWNKQFSKYPSLLSERSLTLVRKKIFIESINKKYVVDISKLYLVVENKDYIILMEDRRHMILVIPKEAFSNNEEKKEFLEILNKFNNVEIKKLYKVKE